MPLARPARSSHPALACQVKGIWSHMSRPNTAKQSSNFGGSFVVAGAPLPVFGSQTN